MNVIVGLAGVVVSVWALSALGLSWFGRHDLPPVRICRFLWAELRPVYLPGVAILIAQHVMAGEMLGWNSLLHACQIFNWFAFKDIDDDDRWKRRKAKLVERIERRGARLVVVPAGGDS